MKKIFFSSNLTFLRKKKGINQLELIDSIGFKRSTWSGYETGNSFPKLEDFLKISEYFNIKTDDLLFIDLSNVHLNENEKGGENTKNVHPNVHPSVHLKGKKGVFKPQTEDELSLVEEPITPPQSEQNIVETMATAIRGLERANARLEQLVERLEEENRRLKSEIPSIGQELEAGEARAS